MSIQSRSNQAGNVRASSHLRSLLIALLSCTTLLLAAAPTASATPTVGLMWSGDLALDSQEEQMEAIDRSGADILRLQLSWGFQALRKVTHPGDIWGPYDDIFQHAWEKGIRIYPYLYGRLDGSGKLPQPSEWEPEGSGWETWLYEVVQRYGHGGSFWSGKSNPLPVITWEIWNEQNLGKNNKDGSTVEPGYYAKFLKRSSEALKAAQSPHGTTILFGGLLELGSGSGKMRPEDYIESAHSAVSGLGSHYTALAHHPYVFKDAEGEAPDNEGDVKEVRDKVRDSLEDVRAAMDNVGSGSKAIWVNELGWPVEHGTSDIPAVSESIQAQLLGYCFNMMVNQSGGNDIFIGAMFYYNHRDIHVNNWAYGSGLRKDNARGYDEPNFRPAWDAFQEQTGASSWPVPANATTKDATNISYRQAKLQSSIDPNGLPTNYNFEWGTTTGYGNETETENRWENKTISESRTITGLTPNTTYHFRFVSTNENAETDNGADKSFKTLAAKPIVSSEAATDISGGKATLHGKVNPNGFATTYHFEWGTQAEFEAGEYNNSTPEAEMEYTGHTESKPVEATIEGIKGLSTYHYRLVAENSEGKAISSDEGFETPDWRPEATTEAAKGVGPGKATLHGSVDPNTLPTTYQFEYGTTTEYGSIAPSEGASAGSGDSPVAVSETVKGLEPETTYHFRVTATNAEATIYGEDLEFTTPSSTITLDASGIDAHGVRLEGEVNPIGSETDYWFEYGASAEYGSQIPVEPESLGSGEAYIDVDQRLEGLFPETTYHYRVVATNAKEKTYYGKDKSFTTTSSAFVSDAPLFEGEESTFHGDGEVEDFVPESHSVQSNELTCYADLGGDIDGEVDESLSGTLAYAFCFQYPSEEMTIYMNGCGFEFYPGTFHSEAERFEGSFDIVCPEGQSIEFASEDYCSFSYPPQTGLRAFYRNLGEETIELEMNTGYVVKHTQITGPYFPKGCPEGEYEDGSLWGRWTISAYDELEEQISIQVEDSLFPAPTATSGEASDIGSDSATLNGSVNPEGFETTYRFEYGTSAEYGSLAPASPQSAGSGTEAVAVEEAIGGLEPETTYHFRVRAESSNGIAYGEDETFTTGPAPVAAYAFNEGEGETVADSAGNHDGTIEGASWTEAGRYGAALDFDGTDDLVEVADASGLDLTEDFTLEAWVRPEDLESASTAIFKGNAVDISGYALGAETGTGKPRGFVAKANSYKFITAPEALEEGEWVHLALTSDTETLRLYVDGELTESIEAIAVGATNGPLQIGHAGYGVGYFDGLIDEVRIYDAELSEAQIQTDMGEGE